MNFRLTVSCLLVVLMLTPVIGATPTGLTYLDSTWISQDADDGTLVTINHNNTIIASVHDDVLVLFDVETLEEMANFEFNKISAIEFSPDGSTLAVNKGSTIQTKESLKLIDIQNMTILEHSALADDRATDIDWSPDGEVIAAPGPEGDVEIYRKSDLSIKNTLYGVHNVDITCIDYRDDGDYLITGDASGRYVIWNSNGTTVGDYREFGEELLDCKFSPNGQDYILLGSNGKLLSRTFAGSENNETNIDGATQISFSDSGTRMHITVESNDFRGLLTYDYTAFDEIKRTTFFHAVEDLAIIDDDFGRLQTIYVAAGTGEIAVYLRQLIPDGYGQPGADLDGDSIPDNMDSDDDGDGIIDTWDDDIGCDAPDGTPCSRYPQLSKIRRIEIDVSDSFVVSDTITLPTTYSSHIRNLSRSSIAADQIISSHEAQLFADAMCANIDQTDIIDQWRESIVLSNGELGEASVNCLLSSGMELIKTGDYSTQIALSIITTFSYDSPVTLPLDISIKEQTLPTDGSIAWLAPAHPVAIYATGDGAVEQEIPLWWNIDGDVAEINLQIELVPETTTFEKMVTIGTHPIAFISYLGMIALLVIFLIRRENKIAFDLDSDDSEEDSLEFEDQEEVSEEIEDSKPTRIPPKQDISTKKTYSSSEKQNISTKRKSAKSKVEVPSNKIKTKRKRVVSDNTEKPIVTRKKVVVTDEPEVKTRKVRKAEIKIQRPEPVDEFLTDEENEGNTAVEVEKMQRPESVEEFLSQNIDENDTVIETKKKRKPVRRKSKADETDKINENKLQGNLVSEFLSED